ncbi:hypothetical protein STCU_09646 [Strigomonas culicis]|uniref:Uncharacterized protein n=1 Tax=Strigomonas culicis TaxID=28005 RepID=S9TR40_9TRYP|nr:hypothetical protein STCU_09646 [Strigomonas culicis]|eukprot:EPY19059.1 hypothetical protein STCU_09646 [Strigomonas culicis]
MRANSPSAPLHELYRCGFLYATFSVSPDDCLVVPPLGSFVMNRTSSEPQEVLLYRILSTVDERTSLGQLSQLLMLDDADVCAAAELLIQLGLARLKRPTIPETVQQCPGTIVHPSWQRIFQELVEQADKGQMAAGQLLSVPKNGEGGQPVKRIALLYDATLTGFLMMTNLSKDPGFKQHAVTLFEVGKMPSDAVSNFLDLLDDVDMEEMDTFSGEAQKYVNSVICLRHLLKALMQLQGPEGGTGVDMYKIEALNELEATTRYSLLGRNFWAYVITSPVSCTPLIDVELCCVYGSTVSLMPSPWFLLFLYTKVRQGPPSLLVPFGALLHSWPPVFTGTQTCGAEEAERGCVGYVSRVRCQAMTLDAEVTCGDLDTSLVLLGEMTLSAPVLVQCAARVELQRQRDGRVVESPHEKTMEISVPFDCTGEELHELVSKRVSALFSTATNVQMDRDSIIGLLEESTSALYLCHSLGYFTLSLVCCMLAGHRNEPEESPCRDATDGGSSHSADNTTTASVVTLRSVYIVSIGLGVPLFDVDCCALIIKRIPRILSEQETTQHNESIRKCVSEFGEFLETYSSLTRQVHEMMAIQTTATAGPMTQQHLRKSAPTGGAPFPSTLLLFDGKALHVVDDANPLSDQW